MNKKEFEEKYVREDLVVHCNTYGKAEKLLIMADSFGYRWCDGGSYVGSFEYGEYKENTCYHIYAGRYCSLEFYVNDHCVIIPFGEGNTNWATMEIIEPPTKESQYGHLLEEYDKLDDRILEILDIVRETVGLYVEVGHYMRSITTKHDFIYVGDNYNFPTAWLWLNDDKIKERLIESKKHLDLKEQQVKKEELAELKRLKEKYEYFC